MVPESYRRFRVSRGTAKEGGIRVFGNGWSATAVRIATSGTKYAGMGLIRESDAIGY